MSEWKCCTCNVQMDEVADIKIRYKDIELPDAPGLRCPQCNIELLTEEFVVEELASAEEMLEAK